MANRQVPYNFSFEIINVTPINPYISSCQIKVFYTGKNRNGSYISKPVGERIANTLPRSPIVAYYNEAIDDYEDHGQELIINRNGIKMITKTVPYGAISETDPIVWQEFADRDGVVREYLVCNGFLWTGRYPHLNSILEYNKGQSMEFFPESVIGEWAKFDNEDQEFFIFNEANISALCILGDDVEPCFEGASIGAPKVLYSLEQKNETFETEFEKFIFELNKVLEKNPEGGNAGMPTEENAIGVETEVETVVDTEVETTIENEPVVEPQTETEFTTETEEEVTEVETEEPVTEFEAEEGTEVTEETETEEEVIETGPEVVEETVSKAEFTALEEKYNTLQATYEDINSKYELLVAEKKATEDAAKEEIFTKFSILGEETLNKVRETKDKFSVEEIEDKLSAIAFKQGISFSLISESASDGVVVPTPQRSTEQLPAWLQAVENKLK
jgi:hypothetical protein